MELILSLDNGTLGQQKIISNKRTAATIVCASGGYPEGYAKGYNIKGLDKIENSMVFQAGTARENNNLITSGGRVLAVTSFGKNKDDAVHQSLESISKISFRDMYYRKDIGFDLL